MNTVIKRTSFSPKRTLLTSALLTALTLPLSAQAIQTQSYTYNTFGLIETIDGKRTDVTDITTFGYDANANLISITNALGHITQITSHDASGRPLTIVDPNGATTTLTYDERGRLLNQDVAGNLTQYNYDATGNLITVTLSNGEIITYHYDSAHRPIGYSDALGNKVTYVLDAAGNQTSESITDPNNTLTRSHQYVYDELNRLRQDIGANNQTASFDYDVNNNQTNQTDPNNNPTNFAFDALDRLITSTDAANGDTSYTYDDRDNLLSVTDPNGNTTTYTYDAFDNLTSQTSPDTGTTTYTYDNAGNRISQTDARNITTSYSYDALNRLLTISYPDNSLNITYSYDENNTGQNGIGRLTSQTDITGTTNYSYDLRGNITGVTTERNNQPYTFNYQYNTADQLTQISYPDGRTLDYQYDLAGRVIQIDTTDNQSNTQTLASNIGYQPFGPMTAKTYGNGLTMSQLNDLDYRQTAQTTAAILERDYGFDPNSNITSITDNITNQSQSFTYDNLDRLTNANDNNAQYGGIEYQYDATHNRAIKDQTLNGLTEAIDYSYPLNSNRLTATSSQTGTANYQYDGNGNIVDNGVYQFSYQDHNRLHTVSQSGQLIATYTYNAQGQRTQKVTQTDTTYYLYGLQGELLAEIDSQGNLKTSYLFANGQLLAIEQQTETTTLPTTAVAEHSTNHNWTTVAIDANSAQTPVVMTGVPSYNGSHQGVIRLNNLTSNSVDIAFQEWDYLDGNHATEQLSLLSLAEGSYTMADGSIWEVGTFNLSDTKNFQSQSFTQSFANPPKVFMTIQTYNEAQAVTVRAKNVTTTGFEAALFEQDSFNADTTNGHATETVAYLAIHNPEPTGAGIAQLNGVDTPYSVETIELKHQFKAVADHSIKLHEEKSLDNETGHTLETVAVLNINGHIFAQDMTTRGNDTVSIRRNSQNPAPVNPVTTESGLYYVHNDHLGTPQVLTDQSQQIVWQASYNPFGEANLIVNTVENNIRFPGQYYDEETQLHYNYFRYYDTTLGRYITSDPIGLAGGINTYAYVESNPINYSDPTGQCPWCVVGLALLAIDLIDTIGDVEDTIDVFSNECSSGDDKAAALGLLAFGIIDKTPGNLIKKASQGVSKPLKEQATDLVAQNGNKNRVTLRSPSQKLEVDLAGRTHGNIPTPHTKVSPRNLNAPKQPAFNTKNSPVRPATQQDIRTVRRFLERRGR